MANWKRVDTNYTLQEAIEAAKTDLEILADDMGNWRDNMDGTGLENTSKYEDVSDCADSLEQGIDTLGDIDVPEFLRGVQVKVSEFKDQKAGWRILDAVVSRLNDSAESLRNDSKLKENDEAQLFAEELEGASSELDGIDFPGMY